MNFIGLLCLLVVGALVTLGSLAPVRGRLPRQRNFTGKTIPTAAGVAFAPVILLSLTTGYLPYAAYLLVAVAVGFLDDVFGDGGARGFRGHVGALLHGRLTTGMLKVLALGGGAVVVGVLEYGTGFSAVFAAFLLAGFANLANLLDVRPGRAIKATLAPALLLVPFAPEASPSVAGVLGGMIGLFYFDVRGRIMLGDAGAAVCGSVVGLVVVASGPGVVWIVAGAIVLALTLVAEFSSISRLIEEVEVLRWLDLWGRVRDE